jgi:hypothetical protein
MIQHLEPTNLIAVEVPALSCNHKSYSSHPNVNLLFDLPDDGGCKVCGSLSWIYDTGEDNHVPIFTILGEVTKDKVGFDVEPYVNVLATHLSSEEKAQVRGNPFYYLLAENGLYFKNPKPVPEKIPGGIISFPSRAYDRLEEWQSFEDKLIKGKLLILKIAK